MSARAFTRQAASAACWTNRAVSQSRGRCAPHAASLPALLLKHTAFLGSPRRLLLTTRQLSHVSAANVRGVAASMVDSVKQKNSDNAVIVYSKTWCPYCSQVKELFKQLSVEAKIVELDQVVEGDEVQDALFDVSGSRTVPQVFIGGEFVGGGDDTMMEEHSGELQKRLAQVGMEVGKL